MIVAVCGKTDFSLVVKGYIEEYLCIRLIQAEVELISSQQECECWYEKISDLHNAVLFCVSDEADTFMKMSEGVRLLSQSVFIVFISSCKAYLEETCDVCAFRYIFADDRLRFRIWECLDTAVSEINSRGQIFKLNTNETIFVSEIVYIESNLHNLYFHINTREEKILKIRKKLDEIEKEIDDRRFIRVHKSYLVNVSYIREIKCCKAQLTVWNKMIPIPKEKYRTVKMKYKDLCDTVMSDFCRKISDF